MPELTDEQRRTERRDWLQAAKNCLQLAKESGDAAAIDRWTRAVAEATAELAQLTRDTPDAHTFYGSDGALVIAVGDMPTMPTHIRIMLADRILRLDLSAGLRPDLTADAETAGVES